MKYVSTILSTSHRTLYSKRFARQRNFSMRIILLQNSDYVCGRVGMFDIISLCFVPSQIIKTFNINEQEGVKVKMFLPFEQLENKNSHMILLNILIFVLGTPPSVSSFFNSCTYLVLASSTTLEASKPQSEILLPYLFSIADTSTVPHPNLGLSSNSSHHRVFPGLLYFLGSLN